MAKWAADNGCYSQGEQFDFERYMNFLHNCANYKGRCLFATVPDVVGDAEATHGRWEQYAPQMREVGLPLAYIAQDGMTELPDVDFDCLFIGGTTEYKLSPTVAELIRSAKEKGKWIHAGRVNTPKRILHFFNLGADSFDGTHWAIEPSDLSRTLVFLRQIHAQRRLL